MRNVQANEATAARRRVYFHLVDASDGITAETGEGSGQPQISTNGGSFTNTGIGTLTHIGNGRYYADLTQSAVASAGDIIETRYKSANTAETPGDSLQVVAFDPVSYPLTTRDVIESQRDDHASVGTGNDYYVDPDNGDTHANGARGGRDDPYSGFQDCHDNAVTSGNHDKIHLVAGSSSAQTTLDEQVTISKDYVFVRGPGQGFLLNTTSNGDLLTISGTGVEVSSLELQTNTTGSGAAVVITGDFAQLRHAVVSRSQGDGIQVTDCSKALIEHCRLYNTGQSGAGEGIAVDGTNSLTQHTEIRDCTILDTQGDAINLSGANVDNTIILHNVIHGSTGWGINIGSNVTATFVTENYLGNNSSGAIQDNGTNSDVERNDDWAASTDISDIYHADIDVVVDDTNSQDEYTVVWYKNGLVQTSGITSPTIQVVKRADGTDLIGSTSMTQIGSTGYYKYDESTNRITAGEAIVVQVQATIDGNTRTWTAPRGRDV